MSGSDTPCKYYDNPAAGPSSSSSLDFTADYPTADYSIADYPITDDSTVDYPGATSFTMTGPNTQEYHCLCLELLESCKIVVHCIEKVESYGERCFVCQASRQISSPA